MIQKLWPQFVGLVGLNAIFLVGGCGTSPKPPPDTAPHELTLTDLQRQYTEAEARLNDMEAADYAANPHLQPAEQRYDQLDAQYHLSLQTIDPQIEVLLDEQKKQHGDDSVRDAYDLVEAQWQMVRKAEQATDPNTAELLRVARLADPDFVTAMGNRMKSEHAELKDMDLSNPDKFWQVYRDSWTSSLQRLTDAATEAEKKLGLPETATLWARKKAAMEMDLDLYGAYLDVATPDDLQDARDALDDLQDQIDAMAPVPAMPSPQQAIAPATQAAAP